jgi:ABC-type polysaccharide/polyol phosphate transport system ATPase subunit
MTSENAIEVLDVRKHCLLYASPAHRFLGLLVQRRSTVRRFHARDGASFTIARGEAVGLLVRNGAGKSTLLGRSGRSMGQTRRRSSAGTRWGPCRCRSG